MQIAPLWTRLKAGFLQLIVWLVLTWLLFQIVMVITMVTAIPSIYVFLVLAGLFALAAVWEALRASRFSPPALKYLVGSILMLVMGLGVTLPTL